MSALKPLKSGAYSACRKVGGDCRGLVVKTSFMGTPMRMIHGLGCPFGAGRVLVEPSQLSIAFFYLFVFAPNLIRKVGPLFGIVHELS